MFLDWTKNLLKLRRDHLNPYYNLANLVSLFVNKNIAKTTCSIVAKFYTLPLNELGSDLGVVDFVSILIYDLISQNW